MCFFSVFCLKLYLSTPGSKNWDTDSNSHQRPTRTWYIEKIGFSTSKNREPTNSTQQPGWGWYALDEFVVFVRCRLQQLQTCSRRKFPRKRGGGWPLCGSWGGGGGGGQKVLKPCVGKEGIEGMSRCQIILVSPKIRSTFQPLKRGNHGYWLHHSTEKITFIFLLLLHPCFRMISGNKGFGEKMRKNDCSMEEILQQLG